MVTRHRFAAIAVAWTAAACCSVFAHAAVASKGVGFAHSLATKTAYWDQRKDSDDSREFAKDVKDYDLVQVQQVSRHGERFPTKGSMQDIMAFVAKLQTNFSDVVPAWIKTYELPYNLSVEGELAPAGVADLQGLGKRTRAAIAGTKIPTAFSPDKFVLQHTYKSRTRDSAKAFASSFFTNPDQVTYVAHSRDNDVLLRFYDQCPKYVRDVDEGGNGTAEADRFMKSAHMAKSISSLQKALRLPSSANLTASDVDAAVAACGFEFALYGVETTWCSLLSKDVVEAVEFKEDLEAFYEQGAGFEINYEIAAVLLQDIVQSMRAIAAGTSQVAGNFRFAHAETTLPLMTLLGYGSRAKLHANASRHAIDARGFRTSALAPFGANIDFRLYKKKAKAKRDCKAANGTSRDGSSASLERTDKGKGEDKDKGEDSGNEAYYVQVLVNERVAKLPGCGKVLCELAKVEALWRYYLHDYDFAAACKV